MTFVPRGRQVKERNDCWQTFQWNKPLNTPDVGTVAPKSDYAFISQ